MAALRRPTWLASAAACAVVFVALAGCGRVREDAPLHTAAAAVTSVPAAAELPPVTGLPDLPPNKHGELVRQGHAIFTNTPVFARRFSGNSLSCSSCHLDAGRRANAAPMWAAWGMYPAYLGKTDRVTTLEERIQQCFRFSMNGFPPPQDSQEMRALLTYMQFVSIGQPIGVEQPGRGFPTVPRTGADPDAFRGKAVYAARCAQCHGKEGEGVRSPSGAAVFPPLWGHDSFNKGAGMNRIDLLAGFVKANMPYDKPDLTDQEALDVAAWITLQERWPDPRKGLITGLLER
ncbi:c-type cytochrome [Ideonella sp.]|uniref:c-type cytochrome n=1 Tax=Ideonella sp. TaxID=1929293 RepID=UPI0035AD954A